MNTFQWIELLRSMWCAETVSKFACSPKCWGILFTFHKIWYLLKAIRTKCRVIDSNFQNMNLVRKKKKNKTEKIPNNFIRSHTFLLFNSLNSIASRYLMSSKNVYVDFMVTTSMNRIEISWACVCICVQFWYTLWMHANRIDTTEMGSM